MSIAEHMLKARINDLELMINHSRSTVLNLLAEIRVAAEEEDYDGIIAICDQWDPEEQEKQHD